MRRRTFRIGALALLVACTAGPTPSESSPPLDIFDEADIGGYALAYQCLGIGPPTIVAEAGYDAAGTSEFAGVLEPLAGISRVCTYDRAGTGNSDDRPRVVDAKGLTSGDEAHELHAMLHAAAIEPPYVLVAHSYGGFVSRLFAAAYPGDVQALVLIESSHEDEIAAYRRHFRDDPEEADWVDGGDLLDIDATAATLRSRARDFGSLPLIAIRAETYDDVLSESLWRSTQADLATLSTDGIEIEALHSGHWVQDDNPHVVIASVQAAVTAARDHARLAACDQIVTGVDARCLT